MRKTMAVATGMVSAVLSVHANLVVFSTDFSSATQPGGVGTGVLHGGTVESGYTVGPFTQGPGYAGMVRLGDLLSSGDIFLSVPAGKNGDQPDGSETTLADAVANGEYFQFTVTAASATDFTGVAFSYVGAGSAKTGGITLRSSADNYIANLATVTGTMNNQKYPVTVDLSTVGGFTELDEVSFRFYFYDDYVGAQNRYIGIDDIEVSVIPEPATLGLFAIASGALMLLRRFVAI